MAQATKVEAIARQWAKRILKTVVDSGDVYNFEDHAGCNLGCGPDQMVGEALAAIRTGVDFEKRAMKHFVGRDEYVSRDGLTKEQVWDYADDILHEELDKLAVAAE